MPTLSPNSYLFDVADAAADSAEALGHLGYLHGINRAVLEKGELTECLEGFADRLSKANLDPDMPYAVSLEPLDDQLHIWRSTHRSMDRSVLIAATHAPIAPRETDLEVDMRYFRPTLHLLGEDLAQTGMNGYEQLEGLRTDQANWQGIYGSTGLQLGALSLSGCVLYQETRRAALAADREEMYGDTDFTTIRLLDSAPFDVPGQGESTSYVKQDDQRFVYGALAMQFASPDIGLRSPIS